MHLYDVERGNLGANAVVGGGLPGDRRRRAGVQAARRAARRGCVLRRRRDEHRHVPRVAQPRRSSGRCRRSSSREQPLGRVDAGVRSSCRSPTSRSAPSRSGCTRSTVDGQDVEAVYRAAKRALDHARSGKGPVFLVCETYRLVGHYVGDPQVYRPEGRAAGAPRDAGSDRRGCASGSASPTRSSMRLDARGAGDRRGLGRVREGRHGSEARGRAQERLRLRCPS